MRLLLVLTFVALVCAARSAPPSSSKDRTLVLPSYHNDDDSDETPLSLDDTDDEMNSTTTTTTTTTTRRSTYVFPTRNRNTLPSRRPWLTQRTSSIQTTTAAIDADEINIYDEDEGVFKYVRNIREFFKKMIEDVKKFFRNINGSDIFKFIQQLFSRKNDD